MVEWYWRGRPLGRPWLRWKDKIRRDSLLLLNIRGCRRLAGDRDIWTQTVEEVRARCGLSRHGIIIIIRIYLHASAGVLSNLSEWYFVYCILHTDWRCNVTSCSSVSVPRDSNVIVTAFIASNVTTFPLFCNLNMVPALCFETPIPVYQIARCHIPYRRENSYVTTERKFEMSKHIGLR
jgi:hypothetical protein